MSGDHEKVRYISRRLVQNLLALAVLHFAFAGLILYALFGPEPRVLWIGLYGIIVCAPAGVLLAYVDAQEEWSGNISVLGLLAVLVILAGAGWIVWYLV